MLLHQRDKMISLHHSLPTNGVGPSNFNAFASVVVSPAVTANVYAVHLKSNYGANTAFKRDMNRDKRTKAVEQLMAIERGRRLRPSIVAGDLNADCWRKEFAEEKIFELFAGASFFNVLSLLPEGERGTHPSWKWGDSALDYIMTRGFKVAVPPRIVPNDELSDHYAVFSVLEMQ